ncbi:MAG TPA: phytoene desaturase family protein [Chitinophagaceae bacterium]|nr:phytoene desaturase family protein [Chitinophagaceae bacterium]
MKKAVVIGAGFSGLSAATFLAKYGWDVSVVEKHDIPGGRARKFSENGFTFDMGPSWYWMPDVFERYFGCFDKKVSDYYSLQRIDPSYRIFWEDEVMDVPANYNDLKNLFETAEPGSGKKLDIYLKQAEYKYNVGIHKLVQKPGQSWTELLDADVIRGIFKLDIFSSIRKHIYKYFENPKLRRLLEFPVLFLGALPENIPALYSLMNFADIKGGTWYPENGIYSVVQAMHGLAVEMGVKFYFNENVASVITKKNVATSVESIDRSGNQKQHIADCVIAAADYHFVESSLLPDHLRSYPETYWEKKVLAPGCLLYYVGLNKKIKSLQHHSLFFDTDFEKHGYEIYESKKWPADPLFYVSAPSVTDETVAPKDCENLFFLIPISSGLTDDTEELRNNYFEKIIARFEKRVGENITKNIVYKKSYGPTNFVDNYNAYKGNAYGLANTLFQTAFLKPSCRSKKIENLFYTGQFTVPGPGVPPSLISGEVVAKEVIKGCRL